MARALYLAKKGQGKVSPNPMVGCVIVKGGEIIGEGYHREFGGPHAEVDAINNCTESPHDADLYVIQDENNFNDVWPLPNGQWDFGEEYADCGYDGLCPGDDYYPGPDIGEGNGAVPIDANELDGNYDTGDGCFGCGSDEMNLFNRFQNTLDNNGD